jgi:hypothetical protein
VLRDFWEGDLVLGIEKRRLQKLRKQADICDIEFCELCQMLQNWVVEKRKSRKSLGLRSAENYEHSEDAPRVATVYNGLAGHAQFVPFRKGDPEGNRWLDDDSLFIDWSSRSVFWLFENSGQKAANMPVIRNPHNFLLAAIQAYSGLSWSGSLILKAHWI